MTDNADLIAEARQRFPEGSLALDLADALEAAERRAAQAEAELKDAYRTDIPSLKDQRDAAIKRAEDAERQRAKVEAHTVMLLRNGRQVLDQRNEYAAVVEKVRAWADEAIGYGEPSGDTVSDLLATAPADLLRDVKADVWDEGADAMAEHIDNGAWWEIQNPYREEQS